VVQAFCVATGFNIARYATDDGVDFVITMRGRKRRRTPCIEVQIKSSCKLVERDGYFSYPLEAAAFDQLSSDDPVGPEQYLFLVRVPNDPAQYTDPSHAGPGFDAGIYWMSLAGMADGRQNSSSRTISVPSDNLLTQEVLTGLLEKAAESDRSRRRGDLGGGIR
jgi:hypothetical protein